MMDSIEQDTSFGEESQSPTDRMLQYMRNEEDISYIVLYHDPTPDGLNAGDRVGVNPELKRGGDQLMFDLKYDVYTNKSESPTTSNISTDEVSLLSIDIDSN